VGFVADGEVVCAGSAEDDVEGGDFVF